MDTKNLSSTSARQITIDPESGLSVHHHLRNDDVASLFWRDVNVTVPDRKGDGLKSILDNVSGKVEAGEMMAIMGPSGCGKTTLLNVLAHRKASAKATVSAEILLNGQEIPRSQFRKLSRFVEAEDTLIGSLTVRETLHFAAKLALSRRLSAAQRKENINELLDAFGLSNQADTIVGTLVKKGISTGQKRRLSVASQLTSAPKILFLDEPTSGLDSAASHNVMSYIRDVAKANNLIVIASIHQPSTTTFNLFDKLLLLSEGKTCYFGPVDGVRTYFDDIGFTMPQFTNPADFILGITNIDFERDTEKARKSLSGIQSVWRNEAQSNENKYAPPAQQASLTSSDSLSSQRTGHSSLLSTTWTLLHRSWIKSRRDVLVYGVRFAMYMGLAVMMGTVWLRLRPTQDNLQPLANCIFFGSAFMSFMAVVYVPAFIEDRLVYVKDRANGLYGSTAFMLSNFIVGLPYLFVIAFASSSFLYWMVNFRPDGTAFMIWVMWMYLNLLAAESLVVFVSCLFPNFVASLALTAMANGIWMACNGFLVPLASLNVFYKYVFYYINYQSWVFRGLASNEFGFRNYSCNDQCYCMYDTPLKDECLVQGAGVLKAYGFEVGEQGKWVGIMIGIIAVLRLFGWAAMEWRR